MSDGPCRSCTYTILLMLAVEELRRADDGTAGLLQCRLLSASLASEAPCLDEGGLPANILVRMLLFPQKRKGR